MAIRIQRHANFSKQATLLDGLDDSSLKWLLCGCGLNRFVHDGMNHISNVKVHLKTRSGNVNIVTKRLHLVMARHSKDPRNQVIGMLKAGSTVNDFTHHFGCSRQTIHDLMNQYNSTASVRVRARPSRAHVAMLHPYRIRL